MVTEFQKKVYCATEKIPCGKVATYKMIAKFIGCNSCQAVGQALRRNPFAPHVPCHRVISSDLNIGGFGGDTAGQKIKDKLKLLSKEGVKFKNGQIIDNDKNLFSFEEL